MSLSNKQFRFTFMVGQLIDFAYKNGYTLSLGSAHARDGHIDDSFHYKRLALDLNLFKNKKYLTKTSDHLPLGKFWESIGGTWGGRWDDGNHYSYGEGVREK